MVVGGLLHMKFLAYPSPSAPSKLRVLYSHHLLLLSGVGSLLWSGHQVHISAPVNKLLLAGIDPSMIPNGSDLLLGDTLQFIFPFLGRYVYPDFSWGLASSSRLLALPLDIEPFSGSIGIPTIAAHHFYVGVSLILSGSIIRFVSLPSASLGLLHSKRDRRTSSHSVLAISLAVVGSLSILTSHQLSSIPVYPYFNSDYPTLLSSFVHHMWIGMFLTIGAFSHAGIHLVRDYSATGKDISKSSYGFLLISHRDTLIAHLTWVCIFLGMHAFGMYIHNDTLQALGRPEDLLSDNAIQLRPVLANSILASNSEGVSYLSVVEGRISYSWNELGTSDFLVHHIHAFTIHVTVLILVKSIVNSRGSRLIQDKASLGFRYPCDGPGRGGTCQVSPWDHIFLGIFWGYNSLAIVVFHFFWKYQSDVWGSYNYSDASISHITGSDFGPYSLTINGWLTNFLWSQASQVIQGYSSGVAGFSLIFLASHFVWALSLMFLYSGRGYWQELIESLLWAHSKLHISVQIYPRALSITQGRAVGVTHYILGGISTTWSFILCRIIAITT
jgi:photosystem I P700 chlorophyll a apoprotein A1